MRLLRVAFLLACLACLAVVLVNGVWEGRLTRINHTWIVDLDRAPVWAPPEMPTYQRFATTFEGSDDFPAESMGGLAIERVLGIEEMALALLFHLWMLTVLAGLLYLLLRTGRRDLVLHLALFAGIGLTSSAVLCLGVWLAFGGWGPPAPTLFAALGLAVGLRAGFVSWRRRSAADAHSSATFLDEP